jgi:hypothetical protein
MHSPGRGRAPTGQVSVTNHVATLSGVGLAARAAAADRPVKYLGDVRDNIRLTTSKRAVSAGIKDAVGAALVRNADRGHPHHGTCNESGVVTLEGASDSGRARPG